MKDIMAVPHAQVWPALPLEEWKDALEFLQSTYEAGANLAKWDRAALERPREDAASGGR